MMWSEKKAYRSAVSLSLALFLVLVSSCRKKDGWRTTTLVYFDTVCEIRCFCDPSDFRRSLKEVHRIFSEIELLFSPETKDYSSCRVLSLYRRAEQIYRATGACFDITVAPLSRIWGFWDESRRVPKPEAIESLLPSIGMDKVVVTEHGLHLEPGMALDWGGIAKGFGIDLASKAFESIGIAKGFINAGGDLYCWGKNPDGAPWKIAVQHPRRSGFIGVLSLENSGAATTGDYQRYFIENGIRYHHVFDPKTGYPARGKQSVTVVGPETLVCDALSTALFVSPEPRNILEKFPEYGALIVDENGRMEQLGRPMFFRPY